MADLEILAELRLRTTAAQGAMRSLSESLGAFQQRLSSAQSASGGLFRSLVSFNLLSAGINAVTSGFRSLVGFATNFSTNLESTRISLAAVMSAVEGLSFEDAGRQAQEVFAQLRDDALTSTATTSELFGIYQSIYGPIRAAGEGLETVREVTGNTVAAASALGVDFAQASRDISMMARGTAGAEVRLFSMLRSTGAIAEDASAFNDLTAPERIARLRTALARFSVASEAYGQSFAGVTSTFQDIVESFTGAAFGPIFARVTSNLRQINNVLLENREEIIGWLTTTGEWIGTHIDRIIQRARAAFTWVSDHWGEIVGRMHNVVSMVQRMAPMLARVAAAWGAISLARAAAPAVAGLGSMVVGAGQGLMSAGSFVMGSAGVAAEGALAGGATLVGAAGAGGTALFVALAEALAPLAAVALVVVSAISAVVSTLWVVYDSWEAFTEMFKYLEPVLNAITEDFQAIAGNLWDVLRPSLTIIGSVILAVLVPAVILAISGIRAFAAYLNQLTAMWALYARVFEARVVNPFRNFMLRLGVDMSRLTMSAWGFSGAVAEVSSLWDELDRKRRAEEDRQRRIDEAAGRRNRPSGDTSTRVDNHNDFRGSRITVNQEFREADPDRVALQMIEDLARFAEQRISSGFVPAFTR